ncbi:cyclic GMP-AMP synthase DncV-like nucleotidyltransferase [Luteibacter sp. RCC_6_2]|uniref:cyclic GMP-AMP synthase DncV-like nucleotidyltransferase n=1 Tax=Luteibacter sp. RCC_6_2 TaxID=3239223 RepID=UPI0035233E72
MFDCSKEMKNFHDDDVALPTAMQTEMRERRKNGRIRLENGLERDGFKTPSFHVQGSYAMKTMVQDDNREFDIDDGAYFSLDALTHDGGNELTPLEAKERVRNALCQDERLANPATIHDNCVRQVYPEGYHIDIPVYRIKVSKGADGNGNQSYELSTKQGWESSDAREVTRWFERKLESVGDGEKGEQLRRVVRLTKSFARSRDGWTEKTGSGITLTRLVCDEFAKVPARDDESLRKTWQAIETRLANSLAVVHPVNDKNLAEDGDEKLNFFLGKLTEALGNLEILDTICTRREAREAWDAVYDTTYFTKQPTPEKRLSVDEAKADDRNDGGGVYG